MLGVSTLAIFKKSLLKRRDWLLLVVYSLAMLLLFLFNERHLVIQYQVILVMLVDHRPAELVSHGWDPLRPAHKVHLVVLNFVQIVRTMRRVIPWDLLACREVKRGFLRR